MHQDAPCPSLRVALLCGGPSGEHDISLLSAASATRALTGPGIELLHVRIGRDGRFALGVAPTEDVPVEAWLSPGQGLAALEARAPHVALLALHGPFGEDGRAQALLEALGVPYVGSGVLASAVAMHKGVARAVLQTAGIPIAAGVTLRRGQPVPLLPLPAFVKPASAGSSIGAGPADDEAELLGRLRDAFEEDDDVVVEERLFGDELTVAVVEDPETGQAEALPVILIRPLGDHRFFDLEAKYTPGHNEELCPAPIDPELAAEAQRVALLAHHALGCRHLSRVDLIATPAGLYALEVNTLPGLTDESLIKKAAAARGWTYSDLLLRLLRAARRA